MVVVSGRNVPPTERVLAMLFSAAVLMLSFAETAWDDRALITLEIAAHEDASWSALVNELVAIGAA